MDFIENKNVILFLTIVIFTLLMAFLCNQFLVSDNLYYNSFAEQLTADKIDALIDQTHRWAWLGYVFIPIIYLLKFSVIALVLLSGFFFANKKVRFSLLFKAVMLAEIPFLLVPLIKLFWFLFIQTHYTFQDLQYFFPLSALQLFEIEKLSLWEIYPLQLLNLFELVYWISMAYWLKRLLHITISSGMEMVMASYGTSLLIWVVFITFLSLNFA
jgi:hypothetical protein